MPAAQLIGRLPEAPLARPVILTLKIWFSELITRPTGCLPSRIPMAHQLPPLSHPLQPPRELRRLARAPLRRPLRWVPRQSLTLPARLSSPTLNAARITPTLI